MPENNVETSRSWGQRRTDMLATVRHSGNQGIYSRTKHHRT